MIDPETVSAEIWTGPALPTHQLTVPLTVPLTVNDAITSTLLPGFTLPLSYLFF
jgi:hypothetical protein